MEVFCIFKRIYALLNFFLFAQGGLVKSCSNLAGYRLWKEFH